MSANTKDDGPAIIVALDVPDANACNSLLDQLDPALCRVKIGKELFTRAGPQQVEAVVKRGFDVFLDLKFHDIPNTVAHACSAAVDLGVWMIDVHASGGAEMMDAARNAVPPSGGVSLIAVTVLTSLDNNALRTLGVSSSSAEQVELLARLAQQSGFDGVVCSPQEAGVLQKTCGDDFLLVTPGVRPASSERGDQVRVMTPADAMAAGSHYLVIGRPITQADNPRKALEDIHSTLAVASGPPTQKIRNPNFLGRRTTS